MPPPPPPPSVIVVVGHSSEPPQNDQPDLLLLPLLSLWWTLFTCIFSEILRIVEFQSFTVTVVSLSSATCPPQVTQQRSNQPADDSPSAVASIMFYSHGVEQRAVTMCGACLPGLAWPGQRALPNHPNNWIVQIRLIDQQQQKRFVVYRFAVQLENYQSHSESH